MQTDKKQRTNRARGHGEIPCDHQAISEVMRLYTAWIAVLMKRQGTDVLRVEAREITEALDGFSCAVSREGDEYVIRLGAATDVPAAESGEEADA